MKTYVIVPCWSAGASALWLKCVCKAAGPCSRPQVWSCSLSFPVLQGRPLSHCRSCQPRCPPRRCRSPALNMPALESLQHVISFSLALGVPSAFPLEVFPFECPALNSFLGAKRVRRVEGVPSCSSREEGVLVHFLFLYRCLHIAEIVQLSLGGLVRLLGPVRQLAFFVSAPPAWSCRFLGLWLPSSVLSPDRLQLVLAEIHGKCLLLWRRVDDFIPREQMSRQATDEPVRPVRTIPVTVETLAHLFSLSRRYSFNHSSCVARITLCHGYHSQCSSAKYTCW